MSLMLHCGANAIDRTGLAHLAVPPPLGPRHFVRPFIDDIEDVIDHFGSIGATLKDEAFGVLYDPLTHLPRRYFGLMEIELPDHVDGSYALEIGVRGSYDQSISRAVAVGSRCFVCDNLAIHGEITFHTKQTLGINRRIPQMIGQAVQKIPAFAEAQSAQFERYRNATITQRQGDAFLVECVRRGALTPSQLGKALEQWDTPEFPEHGEFGWSLWKLHNAVTESLKNPNAQGELAAIWQRTRILTNYLNEAVSHHDMRLAA